MTETGAKIQTFKLTQYLILSEKVNFSLKLHENTTKTFEILKKVGRYHIYIVKSFLEGVNGL